MRRVRRLASNRRDKLPFLNRTRRAPTSNLNDAKDLTESDAKTFVSDEITLGPLLDPNSDDDPDDFTDDGGAHQLVVYTEDRESGNVFQLWTESAYALANSREMTVFLSSSRDIVFDVSEIAVRGAGMALHVAFLPVAVPINVLGQATNLVMGVMGHALLTSVSLVQNTLNQSNEETSGGSRNNDFSITDVVPLAFGAAEQIKNEIGSVVLNFLSPVLSGWTGDRHEQSSAGESSSEQESYLDRLRLDFADSVNVTNDVKQISPSDFSKYLLRVDDLNVLTDSGVKVMYVDLSPEFVNNDITSRAFRALSMEGIALVSSGMEKPDSKLDGSIDWKAEGATQRLLKKRHAMPIDKWYAMMEKELLIWSGSFKRGEGRVLDSPVFLSRGVLSGSSRSVFDLLWDSTRTTEYNKFCLGRSDAMIILRENDSSSGGRLKTIKVVKSETRVPFTSISVVMTTLMYACELQERGTFIIVSRSLASGGAGHHTDRRRVESDRKNEITWGVNMIRSVPGNPGSTDLISISQICSPLVPRFLTHKVGMMAVDNAFNALRSLSL